MLDRESIEGQRLSYPDKRDEFISCLKRASEHPEIEDHLRDCIKRALKQMGYTPKEDILECLERASNYSENNFSACIKEALKRLNS